ncbi:HdeA/HdeB family chaperone [Sphingomonas sp. M1-B02]|uniref:HdeA/HdeB family chaperone n=1 Tax=Sphingomonas sp. M1-B02 TaxID=3114300 RepID=UPI00224017FD|nr:HdeA/HdeB family chaperone [Sphingomonas sp. S6-11]UZK66296.1 HdeA/HdeB family chaperone [Sphingomonas sp. S6-11]
MKTITTSLSLFACLIGAVSAAAQSTTSARNGVITTTRIERNGKQIEKVTCREFLALREDFRPQAISYAIGYDKAKKPEDAVLDVAGIARLVPVIQKTCRTTPQLTLLQRIRADLRRL